MATIDLRYADDKLSGVVGEERIDLDLDVPNSRAGVQGRSLAAVIGGYWNIESNYNNLDPVGLFLGEYDGEPVSIRSEVHLTSYYALRHADITGNLGDTALTARIQPIEKLGLGPAHIQIDGHLGDDTITLIGSMPSHPGGTNINGTIGGRPVTIQSSPHSTRREYAITGDYQGPPALLPLLLGAMLYFH